MGSYEAGTGPDLDQTYGWVATRQLELLERLGLAEVEPTATLASEACVRAVEDQPVEQVPLAERFPNTSRAYGSLLRLAKHAEHVPDTDRDAFIGGTSTTVDEVTLEVLEGIFDAQPEARVTTEQAEAAPDSARFLVRAGRVMRSQVTQARARKAERIEQDRRDQELKDLETLFRMHPDDPDKAIATMRRGQASEADIARAEALMAAFRRDPEATLAAMNEARNLTPIQERRLNQGDLVHELSRLRADRDDRGREGLGVRETDAARYDRYEQQIAARDFDASGAVEELDLRAARDAALAEAAERNKPDGKVLVVTDENMPTAGLVGPMLALAGALEVHTAGVPYYLFTRDYLKGVTKAEFPEQFAFNDVNQRYAVIVLQGAFPPIKPSELVAQIGERAGDAGIVPGDVDQRFIDELLVLVGDPQSEYFGKFNIETRPSRLVAIKSNGDGLVSEVRRTYDRETYLIVRVNAEETKDGSVA